MFIENLENILTQRKITTYKMCKDTNITQSTVSAWKQGKMPTIEKLIKIAEYLNVSADELLGIKKIEQQNQLTELENEILKYFKVLPYPDQMRYIGKLEDAAEPYLQETKLSTLKSG